MTIKCTCGAKAANSPAHASYCDLGKERNPLDFTDEELNNMLDDLFKASADFEVDQFGVVKQVNRK